MLWSFLPLAIWSLSPLLHAENIILSKGSNFHSIVSKLVSKTRIEAVTQSPRVSFVWHPRKRIQMSAIMTLGVILCSQARLQCTAWPRQCIAIFQTKLWRRAQSDFDMADLHFLPPLRQTEMR